VNRPYASKPIEENKLSKGIWWINSDIVHAYFEAIFWNLQRMDV